MPEVGDRAGGYADVFGMGAAARAMGCLHDLGKAAPEFQLYIRGRGSSPDHSTAGAVAALNAYGKRWGVNVWPAPSTGGLTIQPARAPASAWWWAPAWT
ncbi:CRISPR-associated endonuclease Cas3'' [Nitrospirillum viridazoti]|uniref:CRISPR-associated endonuclease Cas3'' n=1 Tax=Nitrospirillum viridazoti TaxID=3144925 RepID=UPI0018E9B26C